MVDCVSLLLSTDFFNGVMCPFTNVIGHWIFAIIVLVGLGMLYMRTEDIAIPSIIGITYGLLGVSMFPPEVVGYYYVVLALAITGLLFGIVKKK